MSRRQARENQIREQALNLMGEITQSWCNHGDMPTNYQMIQLCIYLEALGIIYPQRLNLCEELMCDHDEGEVIPELKKMVEKYGDIVTETEG